MAQAEDTGHCVKLKELRGKDCGNPLSVRVEPTNNCGIPVYVRICIKRSNGSWSCGAYAKMPPGKSDNGFMVCDGTGKYKWTSCTGGYRECGFKP